MRELRALRPAGDREGPSDADGSSAGAGHTMVCPASSEPTTALDTRDLIDFLAPPEAPDELGRLGPYRVRRVLGKGGMGVVFHAEDPQLGRPVALKAMLPALAASDDARRRFLREGRAAAAISHDHVVPVFAVGQDRGVPFLAMPLLQGESLEDRLRREAALPVAEVLRVGREIAAGLAAAHERGLVHRDVKPANVWLEGSQGRVKILDFGLARAVSDGPQLTREGALIGTPAFMSPEQVNGRPVDARGDLFSLGCVLYQMATGRQPFAGPDTTSTLLAVSHCRPRPPEQVRPGLAPALCALILHLLAKNPDDRPASAGAVIAMVAAIEADPALRPERLGLRSRRRRGGAIAAALLLACGAAAAVYCLRPGDGLTVLPTDDSTLEVVLRRDGHIVGIHDARGGETWELDALDCHIETADSPNGLLIDQSEKGVIILRRRGSSVTAGRFLEPPPGAPPETRERARRASPLDAWKELDPAAFPEGKLAGSPVKLVGLLGDRRFRFRGTPSFPAFSPDGRWLALAVGNDVLLFDRPSGGLRRTLHGHGAFAYRLAFTLGGKTVASTGADATVRLWEVESGLLVRTILGHAGLVGGLSFSPDGALAVSSDSAGRILLWDTKTGKTRHHLAGHTDAVGTVAFAPPRGDVVASGGADGTVRLWDVATGRERHRFTISPECQVHLAFSPDGRLLAAGTERRWNERGLQGTVRVWDVGSRREIAALQTPAGWLAFTADGRQLLTTLHRRPNRAAPAVLARWDTTTWRQEASFSVPGEGDAFFPALSPDGRTLAVAPNGDRTVRLFDVASGEQTCPGAGHAGEVVKVAFSPDGNTLASGGKDGVVRLWDLATGREARALTGHGAEVRSVAFSPGGRLVASGSYDGTVRLWSAPTGRALRTFIGHGGQVEGVAFSPRGKRLASAGFDGTVRLWDLVGQESRVLHRHTRPVVGVAFSPDGALLASAGYDNRVVLWDTATGGELRVLPHTCALNAVAFLAEGRVLAGTGGDGTVALWDVPSGTRWRVLTGPTMVVHGLAARGDGRRLAAAGLDGSVHLWDPAVDAAGRPGRLAVPLYPQGNWISGVAFSADGRHLAATSPDGPVAVFRLPAELPAAPVPEAGQGADEVRRFAGHTGPVRAVAFSPDGRRAASASGFLQGDRTVRVWEVATGRQLRCLVGHTDQVLGVAFSPDGRRILSGSWDRTVRLWDVETGAELCRCDGHEGRVEGVAFLPDGRRGLSASWDTTARVWDLGTGKELCRFGGHKGVLIAVAASPNGRRAVSAGYEDSTLRLWDVSTGREVRCLRGHNHQIAAVAFSPDGRRLLSGGNGGELFLWDLDGGGPPRAFPGHTAQMESLAFCPDGRRAFTAGGGDSTVRLWDLEAGKELRVYLGHRGLVCGVAVSPDGRFGLSGGGGEWEDRHVPGSDWALRLWRLPDPPAAPPRQP
jgi:WD40 repeat protein/serine/threonine protein kinase